MKVIFDDVSFHISKLVTQKYSTSFSWAVLMLPKNVRTDIFNIYGFVRFADEIVDTFHEYDKEKLLSKFESDYYNALENGISLNPILNSFQHTVLKNEISDELVQSFLKSMKADLSKNDYNNKAELKSYIHGSANVVGLMCLKVFCKQNKCMYDELHDYAMALGSAFQKVNFLRDLKDDSVELNRSYFPRLKIDSLTEKNKKIIIGEINKEFDNAKIGLTKLPENIKLGVYTAYIYYRRLLNKIGRLKVQELLDKRIRISNGYKIYLMIKSYITVKLGFI